MSTRFGKFGRMDGDFLQRIADDADAAAPVGEYLEHLRALKNAEDKKLRRLATMKLAQQVRAKFLKMSLEEREVFMDVLTADADGSFATLFGMQQKLAADGMGDTYLKLVEETSKSLKKLDDKDGANWFHATAAAQKVAFRHADKLGKLAKPRKGKMPLALPVGESNE